MREAAEQRERVHALELRLQELEAMQPTEEETKEEKQD